LIAFFSILSTDSQCCGTSTRPLLLDIFLEAGIVAIGRYQNSVSPDNALPDGQVELTLENVLVPHAQIKCRKTIVFPHHWHPGTQKLLTALVVREGEIKVDWSVQLDAQGEIERYVRGGLQLKDKSPLGRMRYSADFLLSPCEQVAFSANRELLRGKYADIRKIAEALKPDTFVKWLQNPDTPDEQRLTCALVLGHCGKKEHAAVLRKWIEERAAKIEMPFFDGVYFGYILLDPENGWDLAVKTAERRENPFHGRDQAFEAMRWIGEERIDRVNADTCAAGMARILNVPDMAYRACEALRRWQRWEHCDTILDLCGVPGYEVGLMREAALRFALQCPTPRAKKLVQVARDVRPEWIVEAEGFLAFEKEQANRTKK
jgi:hypothetical protein